jgi:phosphatidylinositol 4-kinase
LNYDLAEKAIASSATQQNENNTHNGVANSTAALSQNSSSPRTASSTPYEKTFPRVFGVWGEVWEDKCRILRDQSPYGHFPSYRIRCLIVKGNDDLRQEWIAMQVMIIFRSIFEEEKINLWLRPYDIIITSSNSGLIGARLC